MTNKYFTDNRTILRSKMGFPEKDKVEKPNWKAVEVKNTELKSEFAKQIEAQEVEEVKPQIVEFGKDVIIEKANEVLKNVFPEYKDIQIVTPDEWTRRVGQSIAAASLPASK